MRACGSEDVLESLPHRKQGRPLLFGDKIDSMVQAYIYEGYVNKGMLRLLKLLSELLEGSCSPSIRQNSRNMVDM